MHQEIESILSSRFHPQILKVTDDSAQHAGHAEVKGSSGGTHFSVMIVADCFRGKSLVQRHRLIYESLESQFKKSIHALAIQAYTPEAYQVRNL